MYTEFENMNKGSRVWIYSAERDLEPTEQDEVLALSKSFVSQWTAHNMALQASCSLLNNRFLVLSVDENSQGASGCSIDSSVNFVRQLESKMGISFLNGGKVAVEVDGKTELLTTSDVKRLSSEGKINETSVVYNHLVQNINELDNSFETTAGNSWLSRFILKKEEA